MQAVSAAPDRKRLAVLLRPEVLEVLAAFAAEHVGSTAPTAPADVGSAPAGVDDLAAEAETHVDGADVLRRLRELLLRPTGDAAQLDEPEDGA